MTIRVLTGDVFDRLSELPDESVQCVVTSPPYWGLRDYGVAGAIGLEPTFDEHLDVIVRVFREVRRVLRHDGTCWLNYGDAYNAGTTAKRPKSGDVDVGGWWNGSNDDGRRVKARDLKPKDLLMMPARIALALQADGWWLRSEIVWHKPNPMPESVRDRPTSAHEKMYLLTKSARYFYDADAVRTEAPERNNNDRKPTSWPTSAQYNGQGANLRNVWKFATEPYRDAHFAVMPTAIVEPCIQAGTSEKGCCEQCGKPWVRDMDREFIGDRRAERGQHVPGEINRRIAAGSGRHPRGNHKFVRWLPSCECEDWDVPFPRYDYVVPARPCTVLDPFGGSGTVGLVADRLGRDAILIELNPDYADMARERIRADAPLLAEVV